MSLRRQTKKARRMGCFSPHLSIILWVFMTYWGYHLLFTLPWIILGVFLLRKRIQTAHILCFFVICVIVMLFTTPWDNYAAYLGIWGFGENVSLGYPFQSYAEKTPWLGHIPIEEYSFFIIEAALVCLVTLFFIRPKRQATRETAK